MEDKKPGKQLKGLLRNSKELGNWIELTDSRGKPVRIPWLWMGIPLLVLILLVGVFDLFHIRPKFIPGDRVWAQAEKEGERSGLEPAFIYAICVAESSLNAHARAGRARGLMQMTPVAWKEVEAGSFGGAFSWRRNMRAGVDYLLFCRELLPEPYRNSYAHLAASYRYGPYKVRAAAGDLSQLPRPKNLIYQELFAGDLQPELLP